MMFVRRSGGPKTLVGRFRSYCTAPIKNPGWPSCGWTTLRAFRVADNKLHELSTWDLEILPIELSELQGMNFDLELLGVSKDDLAKFLDPGVPDGLTDPDEIPEPPDEAITKPGDLWILGDHRLLCGDTRSLKAKKA